jgi:hypothetical protein
MEPLLRTGFIVLVVYGAFCVWREARTGTMRIKDTDEPTILLSRYERPFAFWGFLVLFSAVLAALLAAALLTPLQA